MRLGWLWLVVGVLNITGGYVSYYANLQIEMPQPVPGLMIVVGVLFLYNYDRSLIEYTETSETVIEDMY